MATSRDARQLLFLWLIALLPLWLSLAYGPPMRVDVGSWGDHAMLRGVHGTEQAAHENYRWTTERATLTLPAPAGPQLLRLRAHGYRPPGLTPPAVTIERQGGAWGGFATASEMRVYNLLLPPTHGPNQHVAFIAPTYHPPGDPRWLGFGIDWLTLAALNASPAPWQLGGQALLLGLALLLVGALRLPARWALASAALLVAAFPWANMREPLWLGLALPYWLALALGLLVATVLLRSTLMRWLTPWATPTQAQVAWALLMGALALRLGGAAHPLFDAHDLPVHARWLATVVNGELYLYSTPAELRNQQTFNPPAGYVLLLPLWLLLGDVRLTVQLGVALLDGLALLLLLGIARELRFEARAGLLAFALALALPIGMTMLWWGFAANDIAQGLWLALLWVLLRTTRRPTPWHIALLAVLTALCLTTHAGALVLTVATLGVLMLLGWRRIAPPGRRALLVAFGSACLFVGAIYFVAAVGPVLAQDVDPQKRSLDATLAKGWADRWLRLGLVRRGWLLGYTAPLLLLAPFGVALLALRRRRHELQHSLLGAWFSVSLVFFLAYMALALLTRYIYFAAPFMCLAGGLVLHRSGATRAGRVVVLVLLLLVAWAGATLWAEGALLRVKPSVVPLSH
jgi:toxin CptA